MTAYNPDKPFQDFEYAQRVDAKPLSRLDVATVARAMRDMADYLEANPQANLEITRTAHDAEYADLREADKVTFRVWIEWPRHPAEQRP